MLASDLRALATSRLEEAKILLAQSKPDGAAYLCGYAVEMALKRQICEHLDWDEYPEYDNRLKSFNTHNLLMLLKLAGLEKKAQGATIWVQWQIIFNWKVEYRYQAIGSVSSAQAQQMIGAAEKIMIFLGV